MILGACGFIGSGKGTVGDYLVQEKGWKTLSFAKTLKDMTACVFSWPRELLEGDTSDSRAWRETIDPWWSKKLGKPGLTPRWVLQNLGTDVMRTHFHDDIWILSLERRLASISSDVIITDVRFPNEIKMIRSLDDGNTVWIRRGQLPEWYGMAQAANDPMFLHAPEAHDEMVKLGVHQSEWAWVGQPMDYVIQNDDTVKELHDKIDDLILNIENNRPKR